ncbi:MAG: hypothetical protein DRG78_11300 [Epsilonproteobacteria bacterium]|nr:MAG: hypothetical protein DRG78_11300 [Campylobacterota bacterium]
MGNTLAAIQTTKKSGKEKFYFNDKKLPIDVLSFWQWSSSELLGNALRGVLAEFIVASTIDVLDNPREEWDAYDLQTKKGLKIEIKSSAYLQSWEQKKLSNISFGIQPTGDSQSNSTIRTRKSDIYVFCVLAHTDKESVNPLDLSQWDFYLLDTNILNTKVPTQKTISLSRLLSLKPTHVKYDRLKEVIESYEKRGFIY